MHRGHRLAFQPGFLLAAEDAVGEMLTTGQAAWEVVRLQGITWANRSKEAGSTLGGGPGFIFDGAQLDPDLHTSQSGDWQRAELGELPATANGTFVRTNRHYLTPARLPPQKRTPWLGTTLRHAAGDDIFADPNCVVDENTADASLQSQLAALVRGESCRINPNAAIRAIINLGDYVCQYPSLAIAQGASAMIRLRYAESLWSTASQWPSGNRNVIHGKVFRGLFDQSRRWPGAYPAYAVVACGTICATGSAHPAAEELEIRGLRFEETRLALGEGFRFATNIPHLETIARVALRHITAQCAP